MPTRSASATWKGGLKGGKGSFSGESGAIAGDYSFGSRFENSGGTNPEELLAAADAACFSMALAGALEGAGMKPNSVETTARCTIEKNGGGFTITTMKLECVADVPGADRDTFKDLAEQMKDGCPVSKAFLGNIQIELDARLADSST